MADQLTQQLVSRRQVAKWLALSCVAPAISACATASRRARATRRPPRHLAPVLVDEHRIVRQVVGLRPFRKSGFRLEAESLGDKVLIHNYGHGGGGVSLSWGVGQLALERALATPHRQAAVLGCGAVGMATARLLQDHGFSVSIYARELPPNTTSNIAGAQWSPTTVVDSDRRTASFDAMYVAASRFAFRYFQLLVQARYGITWRENYFLSESPRRPSTGEYALLDDLIPLVDLAPNEHPFGRYYVARMLSMHIEPSVYLPAILTDFRMAGGDVVVRDFPDVTSIAALGEPLIVNCTGLGAATLFGDSDMLPIKGQLTVLVPQPEVDYITIGPGGLYMMPRQDGIILGGTFERGVSTLEPNPVESERIVRGNRALFQSMS